MRAPIPTKPTRMLSFRKLVPVRLLSFKRVVAAHCLAALDLGAGVEQPFKCLIVQNHQAVQSMGMSMEWTVEDNMVDGLFLCATLQGAEEAMPHLHKQERKRPTPVRRRSSRTQALLGRVIPGGWSGRTAPQDSAISSPTPAPSATMDCILAACSTRRPKRSSIERLTQMITAPRVVIFVGYANIY